MNTPQTTGPHQDPSFLETAFSIGSRLCRDALWDERRCNWQGPSMEPVDGRWVVVERTFGPDLYSGTSGIALFLSRLYRATGETVLRTTAEAAMRQAFSRLDDINPEARLGFYSGHMGIAWAAVELGEAFADERWTRQGLELARGLAGVDPAAQPIDVLVGVSGVIPALLGLNRRYGDGFLDHAVRLGDFLVEKARRRAEGWSWTTIGGACRDDLTGFSHGTGGIAWALLELARAAAEKRFHDAALEGFRYERHWYSAAHENWPDLRDPEQMGLGGNGQSGPIYAVQWCHGAPGIGLSRLRAWQILGDDTLRSEAEAALRTTVRDLHQTLGAAANYSLCHGRAGNAELFLYASQVLGDGGYRALAENVGRQGIETYEKHGLPWPCGVNGGGETPNLMLGTAGTGYFYLRLHDPAATPPMVIILPDPST